MRPEIRYTLGVLTVIWTGPGWYSRRQSFSAVPVERVGSGAEAGRIPADTARWFDTARELYAACDMLDAGTLTRRQLREYGLSPPGDTRAAVGRGIPRQDAKGAIDDKLE